MTAGIINVLKPPGMTSHDVVSHIRRIYGIKRVGHAGTLDPAAAGVLPVFLGSATRLIEYTADAEKSYRAELTFGYSTDTGDDTGQIISRAKNGSFPDAGKIEAVLQSFAGASEQIPPMHSAIKIAGKRLYELARAGLEVDRPPRRVFISDISLVKVAAPTVLFDVTCSKGTYIRALCADIGEKIGCPAVMSFLVRTRVGVFTAAAALTLEEIAAAGENALLAPDHAIAAMPELVLSTDQAKAFRNGQTVNIILPGQTPRCRVYNEAGEFVGIGEPRPEDRRLSPAKVFC